MLAVAYVMFVLRVSKLIPSAAPFCVSSYFEKLSTVKSFFHFSVLVEKDQKPKWNPATISDVDDKQVEHYFSPLPPERELLL